MKKQQRGRSIPRQSVPPKSFLQAVCPVLQDFCPEFGCRSLLAGFTAWVGSPYAILPGRAFYVTGDSNGISGYIKRPLQSSMYLCSDHPLRSFLTINSYMAFRIFLALSILSCVGGFTPSNGYGIPSFSHLKIPSVW